MGAAWKAWENSIQKYHEEQLKRRQEILLAKINAEAQRREEGEQVTRKLTLSYR